MSRQVKVLGLHAPHDARSARRLAAWSQAQPNRSAMTVPEENPVLTVSWAADAANVSWAHQEEGSFAITHGEFYNQAELRGFQPGSDPLGPEASDASIALDLWRREGAEGFGQINGPISISLWDARQDRLVLARNRRGVPPLFFAEQSDSFVWGSALKPLLALGLPRNINTQALDAYLAWGYVPSPWTLVEAISKLPPAHCLTRRGDETTTRRYWGPVQRPKLGASKSDTVDRLRATIEKSLRRRVSKDGEIGVLLSGGVDSSLILAGLVEWMDVPTVAFTFHYEECDGPWNEFEEAHELTQHLGVEHHRLSISPRWVADRLPELLDQYEEPFTYGIHTARLEQIRDTGPSTVLTGALSGYVPHWELARSEWLALLLRDYTPEFLWTVLTQLIPKSAKKRPKLLDRIETMARLAGGSIPELYEQKHVNTVVRDDKRRRIYREPKTYSRGKEARRARMEEILVAGESKHSFDQLMLLGSSLLPADHILWWNHRWGEANDIQFRYPFFDDDVVDLMARIPYDDPSKPLLREVAAQVMPRDIAFRSKVAQAAPIWQWLRAPSMRDLVDTYLQAELLEEVGLFRPEPVVDAVEEHMSGEVSHPWLVWTLLCFMIWRKRVMGESNFDDRDAPPSLFGN